MPSFGLIFLSINHEIQIFNHNKNTPNDQINDTLVRNIVEIYGLTKEKCIIIGLEQRDSIMKQFKNYIFEFNQSSFELVFLFQRVNFPIAYLILQMDLNLNG